MAATAEHRPPPRPPCGGAMGESSVARENGRQPTVGRYSGRGRRDVSKPPTPQRRRPRRARPPRMTAATAEGEDGRRGGAEQARLPRDLVTLP